MSTADPVQPAPPVYRQARLLVAVLVVCTAAVLFWPSSDSAAAPGGFLIDAAGRPSPIGERMAPVTLVHFWATWCPPCLTEVPSLQRLSADLDQYRGDFALLMISVADDQERVEQFVGQRAASVLYDPQWEVTHRYGTRKLPETYLVVQGEVVERFVGAQDWDDPALRRKIVAAVEKVRPTPEATS